jgi:hypothetical protein
MKLLARTFLLFSASLLLCLALATVGFAQSSNGVIAGVVLDKSGAAVPDATVQATSSDRGGEPRTITTDSSGAYRIEGLLPGSYVVLVKKQGFTDFKVSDVTVRASLTTTVNATLEVGSVAATVVVEASVGQELQTQSGDLTANFGKTEIQQLPILSLNPISLALTQAGVSGAPSNADFTNGVGFSVNGTRPRANNFLIDGQDDNDNAINGQAYQPTNLEAIQEVTVLTNSYSAQYGRGGGSVTNVISRGGTNQWHGSVFEYHRNSALAAIPHEDVQVGVTKNPVDIENIFGFTIGGPIIHNKLFVFGSPQWDRERQTQNGSTLTLPTANGVATLQALQPTLSAGGQANVQFLLDSLGGLVGVIPSGPGGTFNTIPLGDDPGTGNPRPGVEIGRVQRSGVGAKSNDRQEWIRVDWNASDKDVVSARYIRDDFSLTPDFFNFPGSLPPYDAQQGGPSQTFGATWSHTFSPRVVNELRASYTNIGFTFGPTPATAANPLSQHPLYAISGSGFPSFGFPTALPQGRAHKTYQYQELLSYTVGKHTFRGGVDVNHLSVVDQIPFNSRGSITFNAGGAIPSGGTYTSLANFVDDMTGASGTAAKVFGNPTLKPFVTTYAPYVEDTWRMRSNLTATLGLRYEYWGTVENALQFPALDSSFGIGVPGATFPGSFSAPQISDRNNFGPRVGVAYTPHFWRRLMGEDKTVLRAGYGIFYDGLFTNILDNTGAAQPNAVGGTVVGGSGRGLANASALIASVQPTLNPLGGITTITSNLTNPLTQQWNFDIQRELPGSFILTAAYVGTRGQHLYVNQQLNPRVDFGARLNTAFGPITARTNGGDSIYHSFQLQADRKFTHGLLLRGAYTFSKLIDDGSEVFVTTGASSFSQDPFNQAGDRGLSAFDHRHRFVLTYLWDLPYVHSSNGAMGVLKAITRDWQTSATATFSTGSPDTVFTGFDILGDGSGVNDRPNLGNPSAPFTSIGIDGTQLGLTSTPGTFFGPNIQDCLNGAPACVQVDPNSVHFLIQASGVGNLGRNTYEAPGFQTWNMSVQRTIRFTERHALTMRGEFYNAFNHGNLGHPSLDMLDPDFNNLVITNAGGRQIRLYLKYFF